MSAPWPDLPPGWSSDKTTRQKYRELILAAKIDLAKGVAGAKPEPPKSLADDDAEKRLHENLAKLVSASIDRSREGAKFVETAAAALGTVYTGILAFSFAAANSTLPVRGVYAAIFLGIAIVGAAFYLAFIQQIKSIGRVDYRGPRPEDQWRRTEYLGAWTGAVVKARAWALRTAVVALAFGVAFMPLAFLPDTIATNPLAVADVSDAPTTPSATPDWPDPPTADADPAVLAVLYKAQLDKFVKDLDKPGTPTAGTGTSTNILAMRLFTIALAVLAGVALWDRIRAAWRWLKGAAAKRLMTS